MKKKVFSALLIIFLLCITLSGCTISFSFNGGKTITNTEPLSVQTGASATEIAEEYISATVTITIVDETSKQVSLGSGVAVHSGGYIATNWHVIDAVIENDDYSLKVYLNESSEGYSAELLWYNVNVDMAIIRCSYYNIPFVKMADRWINSNNNLTILEQVIAIGTPIEFSLQNTVTTGYISSTVKRNSVSGGRVYEDLIQHTAPISNGNSGGPLFDMYGNLIALNTLGLTDKQATINQSGYAANSLFFAVPIYPIMQVIDRVVDGSFVMPVLGVSGNDSIEAGLSGKNNISENGFNVVSITDNSASLGKLVAGDIIKKITIPNGKVFNIENRNDMVYCLINCKPNDTIIVEYKRAGSNFSVDVTLK